MSSDITQFDFSIPLMPEIVRVPEPRPPQKVPVTGYDVKTLRKQNDFLAAEIKDREERHILLYQQNRQLWKYIQDLINASRKNAHSMKEHVTKLHNELHHSHEIRSELASQLVVARDSKALIKQIYKNIGKAQFEFADAERLCDEAEKSLNLARNEAELLHSNVKKKMEHLQLINWQIDESVDREKIDSLMLIAEEFWSTNLIILRSAYNRFKRGVGRRIKLSNMFRIMRRAYDKQIKGKYFALYKFYIRKRSFMQGCVRRRRSDVATRCLMKWKLYAATESHCKRARRRKLIQSAFDDWARQLKEKKFNERAEFLTVDFQCKQLVARAFKGWKTQCMILGWHSPITAMLERKSVNHFKLRVFKALREVSRKEHFRMQEKVQEVRSQAVNRAFDAWKNTCKALWQRRGLLMVRFIRNSQSLVLQSSRHAKNISRACEANVALSKCHAWKRWRTHHLNCAHVKRKALRFTAQSIFRHRHLLRNYFIVIRVVTATSRRRFCCFEVSKRHHTFRGMKRGFLSWRTNVQADIAYKRRCNKKIFAQVMHSWRMRVFSVQQRRVAASAAEACRRRKNKQSLRVVLSHLSMMSRYRKNLTYATKWIFRAVIKRRLLRCFGTWRNKWMSVIFMRLKESHIEAERCKVLIGLKIAELQDLNRNRMELASIVDEQKQKAGLLQAALDEKEKLVRESAEVLELRRKEKQSMLVEWEDLRRQLDAANEERRRLSEIENLLMHEREKDNEYLASRNREAEKLVQSLQIRNEALHTDAKFAKELAEDAVRIATKSIAYEKSLLQESEATAQALEHLEKAKKEEVDLKSHAYLDLQQNLEAMQQRLNVVLKEGFSDVNKAESELRNRTSQVRVTSSNASVLEARNAELEKIIHEEGLQLLQMQNRRITRCESIEMESLGALKSNLYAMHERVQNLVTRVGVSEI